MSRLLLSPSTCLHPTSVSKIVHPVPSLNADAKTAAACSLAPIQLLHGGQLDLCSLCSHLPAQISRDSSADTCPHKDVPLPKGQVLTEQFRGGPETMCRLGGHVVGQKSLFQELRYGLVLLIYTAAPPLLPRPPLPARVDASLPNDITGSRFRLWMGECWPWFVIGALGHVMGVGGVRHLVTVVEWVGHVVCI